MGKKQDVTEQASATSGPSDNGNAIAVGPSGQLRLIVDPEIFTTGLSGSLLTQLKLDLISSNAAGLVRLASSSWPAELPATFAYWRNWVRIFFRGVCSSEEEPGPSWRSLPCPPDEDLSVLVNSAPPMVGLEYVTVPLLQQSWRDLCEYAASSAVADAGGPLAWLQRINPLAHLVGKVTFHLAENKRDPERPFAFLATFAHKVSAKSKPQHRPLADAVKQSVAESDRDQLERLLEPVRRAAEKSTFVAELLKSKRLFAAQAWSAQEAYRFLQESPLMEEAGVVIRLPNWWATRRTSRPQVQVRIGEKEPSALGLNGLIDFDAHVVIDGAELTPEELERLLAESPGLTLLRGKWVEVDQQRLKEALDHWRSLRESNPHGLDLVEGMRLLAGATIIPGEEPDEVVADWSSVAAGDWLKSTLLRMRGSGESDLCQPGRDLNATLRSYQVDGVRWLWFMTELGLGACLADDMGLGKTIQILDLLLQRKRAAGNQPVAPSLLIVPASLLGNWKQEAARFAPSLRVCLVHRSEMDVDELERRTSGGRKTQKSKEKSNKGPEKANGGQAPGSEPVPNWSDAPGFRDVDLVVTSYGMVRRQEWLKDIRWSLIILDEAQAIKNAGAAQTKAVKGLRSDRRIVMTGTPIENHVGELWSLFDFSSPGLLGSAGDFKRYVSRLNKQKDGQAYAGLRRLVRPYILRRQKTDPEIARDLPEKIEMRAECGLSVQQTVLYASVIENLKLQLEEVEGIKRRGLILSVLMQFKQICNHPDLYLKEATYDPQHSGKFERLAQLCEPVIARQEKVLVFTQFQSMCEPLADYLKTIFGLPGLVLHGGTPVKRRSELVKEFQQDPDRPFFVISLKAGGSGLNLTAASHVVHFDRWWNPAVENQATDRAFRIGQKSNVLVHKFVCRGTVEERIDAMIADKRAIAEQILDAEGSPHLTELSDDELLKFVSLDLTRATG